MRYKRKKIKKKKKKKEAWKRRGELENNFIGRKKNPTKKSVELPFTDLNSVCHL